MAINTPLQPRATRMVVAALAIGLAWPAAVPAQVRLPSLGESVSDEVSVATEKRLGDQVMREIRRDPDYLDDPLLLDYLQSIWQPLVAAARARGEIGADLERGFAWESFLVRDRSVNAFALPGGYIGVHLGLIAMTGSRDELASVLAHELSHVSQRHIARSITASSRQGMLATAAMILGVIAASRSSNSDAAQAVVVGGQAAAAQAQLNFSRDMEREADRVGFGVLAAAGFRPAGMASMFDKLEHVNRLNDSGAYPYLRSHPLTAERIGDARTRAGTAAPAAGPAPAAAAGDEHALMQVRARVLMDPSVTALRRLQAQDEPGAAVPAGDAERIGAVYGSALASLQLREFDRAERALATMRPLADKAGAGTRRALRLAQAQLAVARGQAAQAVALLADGDGTRATLLAQAQAAVAARTPQPLDHALQALQSWLTEHRQDAGAWALLSQCATARGQPLRAIRAEAESRAALGDLPGAIDRMRAGQRLARGGAPQGAEFMEASIVDARLRELQAQQRELMAELRGGRSGGGRDTPAD